MWRKESRAPEAVAPHEPPTVVSSEALPDLTDEQWAAGRKIAGFCGFTTEQLEQTMVWGGIKATVIYGLAHSAHHMGPFKPDQIRLAVANGVAEHEKALLDNPNQAL